MKVAADFDDALDLAEDARAYELLRTEVEWSRVEERASRSLLDVLPPSTEEASDPRSES